MPSTNELVMAGIGGLLICIASSLHLLIAGRLTGFASIVFGAVRLESLSIICGLILASTLTYILYGFKKINDATLFDPPEKLIGNLNLIGFAVSGFLAGFGTKLGNGCTSGHGVCGLPRFSIRSIVAVGCFMTFGILIATFKYNNPFLNDTQSLDIVKDIDFKLSAYAFCGISSFGILLLLIFNIKNKDQLKNNLTSFIVGIIFSLALILSGMVKRTKVIGFLQVSDEWDPSLAIVMAVAVLGNILTFYYIIKIKQTPVINYVLEIPTNKTIDWKLILGECIFGLGWGLGGMCPGPAMLLLFFLTPHITACWMISFIIGQQIVPYMLKCIEERSINIKYSSIS